MIGMKINEKVTRKPRDNVGKMDEQHGMKEAVSSKCDSNQGFDYVPLDKLSPWLD